MNKGKKGLAGIRPWSVLAMGLLLSIGIWACYPGGPNSSAELTTVSTGHDKNFDYAKRTYAFIDSIVHLKDEDNPANNVDLSRDYDAAILATIRSNMSTLGYDEIPLNELVDGSGNPLPGAPDVDLVMLTAAVGIKNLGYGWSPWYPWYGWWPGWGYWPGYPGWDWGYPWYPGGPGTVYQYDTGTLLIGMFDPENVDPDSLEQNLAWLAAINGVLNSVNSGQAESFITGLVDQAYKQSPYLGAGN